MNLGCDLWKLTIWFSAATSSRTNHKVMNEPYHTKQPQHNTYEHMFKLFNNLLMDPSSKLMKIEASKLSPLRFLKIFNPSKINTPHHYDKEKKKNNLLIEPRKDAYPIAPSPLRHPYLSLDLVRPWSIYSNKKAVIFLIFIFQTRVLI